MRRTAVALILPVLLLAFAGCDEGDAPDAAGSASPSVIPTSSAAAGISGTVAAGGTPRPIPTNNDPLLESALLALDDLGETWEMLPMEQATIPTAFLCGERFDQPQALVMRAFVLGATEAVVQAVHRVEQPYDDIARLRRALASCDVLISTDGAARTEYAVREHPFPPFGDESIAIEQRESNRSGVLITMRVGEYVAMVSHDGLQRDAALTEGLAARVEELLRELVERRD